MRSPFAYTPRPGPLQAASPGAAILYLGSLVVVAFLYSNPLVLAAAGLAAILAGRAAGASGAVRAALRMGLVFGVAIAVVNALVTHRGETVLLRLGGWPLLGQEDVTLEALVAGAMIALRAAVTMVAFAVYSACVDPDRVLRALRPLARRSALTAALVSRLVPVAAADAARLREAARLRGPAAAPLGRAALARRLLAGSLDRAVDVAATLELRGYALPPARLTAPDVGRDGALAPAGSMRAGRAGRTLRSRFKSRYDRRFYATGLTVLAFAIAGRVLGVGSFSEYPAISMAVGIPTLGLCALIVLAGLAPLRGRHSAGRPGAAVTPRHLVPPVSAGSTASPEVSSV